MRSDLSVSSDGLAVNPTNLSRPTSQIGRIFIAYSQLKSTGTRSFITEKLVNSVSFCQSSSRDIVPVLACRHSDGADQTTHAISVIPKTYFSAGSVQTVSEPPRAV